MISFESRGNFNNTERFLKKMNSNQVSSALVSLAQQGVAALAKATPLDSGITADSWSFEIKRSRSETSITWRNNHMVGGKPLVILLQYGHGTGTGGYVRGRDFINPAIQPIFDRISEDVWKVVTSS